MSEKVGVGELLLKESALQDDTEPSSTKEGRQCKICLGGEEEEDELGRLISPCKCKGTIKYVHLECLNRWRKVPTPACPWCCGD